MDTGWNRQVIEDAPDCNRIFFLHVPKTGGISLGNYLRGLFTPDLICPQPPGGGIWRYTAQDVACYRLFCGHFDIDFINSVESGGFKLTILRDPLSRLVSMYDFWRSIALETVAEHLWNATVNAPLFARTHTFGAFLRTDNPAVREAIENATARQLLGRRFDKLAENPALAAQEAFASLRSFDWYSTTEGLSAALPTLAAMMKKPAPEQVHVHRTYAPERHEARVPLTPTVPSRDDIRYCTEINQIDLRLHRLASTERSHSPFQSTLPWLRRKFAALQRDPRPAAGS